MCQAHSHNDSNAVTITPPQNTPVAAGISARQPLTQSGQQLEALLQERIVFLDGAMGTNIQAHKLTEADFRGERFKDYPSDLKGNNDLLALTRPDVIEAIHLAFFRAGADIAETNTFSSTTIAQADYFNDEKLKPYGLTLKTFVHELNVAAAKLAKRAATTVQAEEGRPCWVAGAVGPTSKTLSMSRDVNDPGKREVTFQQVKEGYLEQIAALVEGGVDLILIETIFDTLNAKAAIFAYEEYFEGKKERLPLMVSGTITDQSGRTLSGQTTEAFWNSVRHARPLTIGMNCALGADLMRPYIEELSRVADTFVSCYPNAGLPDPLSPTGFPEGPQDTARAVERFAKDGFVNILGGCCGTTPEHIAAIVRTNREHPPRKVPTVPPALRLSGLEPLNVQS